MVLVNYGRRPLLIFVWLLKMEVLNLTKALSNQKTLDNGHKGRCFLKKKAAAQHCDKCFKMGRQLEVLNKWNKLLFRKTGNKQLCTKAKDYQ